MKKVFERASGGGGGKGGDVLRGRSEKQSTSAHPTDLKNTRERCSENRPLDGRSTVLARSGATELRARRTSKCEANCVCWIMAHLRAGATAWRHSSSNRRDSHA